ncbi:MAG: LysM peptidoglycan-binding domain-containing protein [bacterium]|nr:LysM peptidoglycan-binding domain-containing protein [bacterium]
MDLKSFWQSSRSTIVSGIIAIVVIAGLFILFNALPAGQSGSKNEKQNQEQQKQEKETKKEKETKEGNDAQDSKVTLPTKYTVTRGDHLWSIAARFYGTGYNWTILANANRLTNPDVIHAGNVLTIPKTQVSGRSHTVVTGDTLWSIAQASYGSGFQWTKIADANPGKIGTLPDGNQGLITPGQILAIP